MFSLIRGHDIIIKILSFYHNIFTVKINCAKRIGILRCNGMKTSQLKQRLNCLLKYDEFMK